MSTIAAISDPHLKDQVNWLIPAQAAMSTSIQDQSLAIMCVNRSCKETNVR